MSKNRKYKSSVRFTGIEDDDLLSITEPSTPNITEQAQQLKKTFSFDTLYKLSRDTKHRDKLQREVLSSVWRPKNQKVSLPQRLGRSLDRTTSQGNRRILNDFWFMRLEAQRAPLC